MICLIDGSDLFFNVRKIYGDQKFDYQKDLINKLQGEEFKVIFITTAVETNVGQMKFLQYLEKLNFDIWKRKFGDNHSVEMAFLLGKINEPCVVVSHDALLLPMLIETNSILAAFSDCLSHITLKAIYRDKTIQFVDLMKT